MPCFKVDGRPSPASTASSTTAPTSRTAATSSAGQRDPRRCTVASKGTLQFPVDRPLPKALVRKTGPGAPPRDRARAHGSSSGGAARSAEERLADEAAGADAGRARERAGGVVADVLVERVGGEVLLHRDEAGARVALVGDEEQARVELVGDRVDAVGEREAAAQQPRRRRSRRARRGGCARRPGSPAAPSFLAVRFDGVVLLRARRAARPRCLLRPMVSSWSASVERSQISSIMRMRRVTR